MPTIRFSMIDSSFHSFLSFLLYSFSKTANSIPHSIFIVAFGISKWCKNSVDYIMKKDKNNP